jgi:hypothetical protein
MSSATEKHYHILLNSPPGTQPDSHAHLDPGFWKTPVDIDGPHLRWEAAESAARGEPESLDAGEPCAREDGVSGGGCEGEAEACRGQEARSEPVLLSMVFSFEAGGILRRLHGIRDRLCIMDFC